jgi:MOSC domain-containing protein YiiM
MTYGALGENILIDYNPYDLAIGSQIQIGEVVLEITQNCTICNHLSFIDKTLPKLLKDDRGIFVKVVKVGVIKKRDKLYLL